MHRPQPVPPDAFPTDADRHGITASAPQPDRLVQLLAMLILFLLRTGLGMRRCRAATSLLPAWMRERPDLPAASAMALAASIRGGFGNAIAWMCMRRGIGPGHPDWPYLAHSIVAFGGSLQRVDGRRYPMQWWESRWIAPAVVGPEPEAPSAAALLLAQAASAAEPAWQAAGAPARQAAPAGLRQARVPAAATLAWLRAFVRAGTGPPTGPPRLPMPSCLQHGAGPRPAPPYRFVPPPQPGSMPPVSRPGVASARTCATPSRA